MKQRETRKRLTLKKQVSDKTCYFQKFKIIGSFGRNSGHGT